jgi:hypothetical protein
VATATKRTPDGRVQIEESEGRVETRFSPVLDCTTQAEMSQVWSTDVGAFSEGQVELSASVRGNASAEWTALEVAAFGWIGPVATRLGVWQLGGSKNVARIPLEQGEAYDRITFEACPVVNGSRGPGALTPQEARLAVALKLWG